MKKVLLDTNTLLSFFTDRNERQRNDIARLFQEALNGEVEIILHHHVLSEMIFTLLNVYQEKPERASEVLLDTIEHPGVALESEIRWPAVVQMWPSSFRDFDDAILAAVAKERACPVFTFDKAFGKQLQRAGMTWANQPKS